MIVSSDMQDKYLDLQALAGYSSLKVSTLRGRIKADNLPCFKVRGKILVRRSEFDRWVEGFRFVKHQEINQVVDSVLEDLASD